MKSTGQHPEVNEPGKVAHSGTSRRRHVARRARRPSRRVTDVGLSLGTFRHRVARMVARARLPQMPRLILATLANGAAREILKRGQADTRNVGLMTLFDVFSCPGCGSRMSRIAWILDSEAIRRILKAVGLSADSPAPSPAKSPEELFGGAPAN